MTAFTTWPAPPEPSPWDGMVLHTVPPLRSDRPAPRVAVRPAPRPKRRRSPPPPTKQLEGIALRFGEWTRPKLGGELSGYEHALFARGALDRSLLRILRGEATYGLWVNHQKESKLLADNRDCCLQVWLDGDTFRFCLRGATADAKLAILAARALGWRGLSVGFSITRYRRVAYPGDGSPAVVITRARLKEISLVETPGCPGSRLSL